MIASHIAIRGLMIAALAFFIAACSSDTSDQASAPVDPGQTAAEDAEQEGPPSVDRGDVEEESLDDNPFGAPTQESLENYAGNDRVFFAFDRSELSPAARETLQKQGEWLREHRRVSAVIEGHADERGTREYNLALGERRATAVKNYLVALGVSGDRLTTISYGKERPAVLGSGEDVWSQNRRAVLNVQRPGA